MCIRDSYGTIGSGADESDKVLSGYVAGLPREKRESIDKQEGLVKVIDATNASSNLNMGVGGSPSIIHVSNDGIKEPNENQCILASELVKGLNWGLLDKEFVYSAVAKLVYDSADFNQVYDEMMRVSSDTRRLCSVRSLI